MTKLEAFKLTGREIAARVGAGEWSAVDVAKLYVERTERYAKELGTHLHFDADDVLKQAKNVENLVGAGAKLPLAGVPVVIKDNIATKGEPTTCGSKILAGFKPPYDAFVVAKLRAAGAVLFGKANCDEFAMGSSNENSAFGPVKNPWDRTRVPGGSSGGSAAAVAAALAPLALGSDTGGSIRQPAALCGIVGLKPSYGRVSRYGLVAYGSSLDQIGPLARDVADTALLLDVISGHDERDSTSKPLAPTQAFDLVASRKDAKGIRIGLVSEFFGDGVDHGTTKALDQAVQVYKDLGAEIVPVSLPYVKYSIAAYYVIATAEASANLARYDGVKYGYRTEGRDLSLKSMYKKTRSEGFGKEVKQRIMLGTFALSSGYYDAYYAKANRAREMIRRDFEQAFRKVDLLLSPTSPTTAFKLGEKISDPLSMYLSDICTIALNLAGLPGVSIPCGFDDKGLPVGLQLMGKSFGEDELLKGAYLYEQATKWTERQPAL